MITTVFNPILPSKVYLIYKDGRHLGEVPANNPTEAVRWFKSKYRCGGCAAILKNWKPSVDVPAKRT